MEFSTPPYSSTWLLNMVPSSAAQTGLLASLQYQAAKITIRTKINILKCALIVELGWEPINAFLDRQDFLKIF